MKGETLQSFITGWATPYIVGFMMECQFSSDAKYPSFSISPFETNRIEKLHKHWKAMATEK